MLQSGWYASTCTPTLVCVCVSVCVLVNFPSCSFPSRCVLCCTHTPAGAPRRSWTPSRCGRGWEGEKDPQHTSTIAYTQHKPLESNSFPDQSTSLLVSPQSLSSFVCACVFVCVRKFAHTHIPLWTCCAHTQMLMMTMRAKQQYTRHPRR